MVNLLKNDTMKFVSTLLLGLFFHTISSYGQLVNCRPRICMIDYNYHDDNVSNADKTAIKALKPDILIDNTPGGLWHGDCLPSEYTPWGIKVFSYITSGYEATTRHPDTSGLTLNLSRIDAIAADGASGVFLDEVSHHPDAAAKDYLTAIYDRCRTRGLKLIFNTGVSNFDAWLMTRCNYIMTDENYSGSRPLSTSEAPFKDSVLVVANGKTNYTDAAIISTGARANGFGYSYACNLYVNVPSWLSSYGDAITQPPSPPVITNLGGILTSSASFGNQWYVGSSPIPGATNITYSPTTNGTYYSIVTIDGCNSSPSNSIPVTTVSIDQIKTTTAIINPNPANGYFSIATGNNETDIYIFSSDGKLLLYQEKYKSNTPFDINELSNGIYIVGLKFSENNNFCNFKLVIIHYAIIVLK